MYPERNGEPMRQRGLLLMLAVLFLLALIPSACAAGVTWTGTEWDGSTEGEYPNRNCDIVSIGKEPARVDSIPYDSLQAALQGAAF